MIVFLLFLISAPVIMVANNTNDCVKHGYDNSEFIFEKMTAVCVAVENGESTIINLDILESK